jgi:glycosyltransferase involved in cell wall biosynthesis
MRVAIVSEHASPLAALGGPDAGGQNVHVAALSERLARLGAEVRVYTRRDDPAASRRVRTRGYEVVHVDAGPATPLPKDDLYPHMRAFAGKLVGEWRRWRPDVAHAHFWMSGIATREASLHVDVPVLLTFHALGTVKRRYQRSADTSPPQRIAEERRLVHTVEHVIATCTDEVRELHALGARPDSVTVIPCGVDCGHFTPRGARLARGAHPRLVAVGRLVERKGLAEVVLALAELPEAELLIAGGPPAGGLDGCEDVRRLLALARATGVAGRVRMLGSVERGDVPALMRSADVVVGVPWYEPFGIVPVEAMACGVPVVGSAVGGLLDTVVDGVTGLLVPPRDPRALAAAVRRLLSDPAARRRLGRAGARRARMYDWSEIASRTLATYERVAEQWRERAAAVGT